MEGVFSWWHKVLFWLLQNGVYPRARAVSYPEGSWTRENNAIAKCQTLLSFSQMEEFETARSQHAV